MAPVNSTWGLESRSVAIRVKGLAGGAAIAGGLDGIRLFLAVKHHEIKKATERVRDCPADDWTTRVDDFEVAELFEFL